MSQSNLSSLLPNRTLQQCIKLTVGVLVAWLVLVGVAYSVAGNWGVVGLSVASLLCLIPGWIVFVLVSSTPKVESQGVFILAGTLIRMLFVLAGLLYCRFFFPRLGVSEFVVWLVVFYLYTLLLETIFLLRTRESDLGSNLGSNLSVPHVSQEASASSN